MLVHKLIDWLTHGIAIEDPHKDIYEAQLKLLDSCVMIDLGSGEDCPGKDGDRVDVTRLPYEYVFCEMDLEGKTIGMLMSEDDDIEKGKPIEIFGSLFVTAEGNKDDFGWSGMHFRRVGNEEPYIIVNPDIVEQFHNQGEGSKEHVRKCLEKNAVWWLALTFTFISIMNCTNVELVDNIPSRLKQSRIKKGKSKLYEFKTLHIKQSSTRNINRGEGTHASPRVHLRRGHKREYKPGLWTWVQQCCVGSREKGIVHKDYVLDPEPELED